MTARYLTNNLLFTVTNWDRKQDLHFFFLSEVMIRLCEGFCNTESFWTSFSSSFLSLLPPQQKNKTKSRRLIDYGMLWQDVGRDRMLKHFSEGDRISSNSACQTFRQYVDFFASNLRLRCFFVALLTLNHFLTRISLRVYLFDGKLIEHRIDKHLTAAQMLTNFLPQNHII